MTDRKLTGKQQAFVDFYIICQFNATEAARRAGYAGSDATLAAQGYENLRKPHIVAAIAKRTAERGMEADEVIARLAEHGRAEYARYFDDSGRVDIAQMLKDGKGHLIKSVKETAHGRQVEFYDAQKALVQLGRAHGIFVDKVAPTDPSGQEEYGRENLTRVLAMEGLVGLYEAVRAREMASGVDGSVGPTVDTATGTTE